ncbi:MAG: outer membrane beta-barrel protein [Chitinophagaceae bacterium]
MKKVLKTTAVFTMAIIMAHSAGAQGLEVNANYNVSRPIGREFRHFVSKTTFGSFQAAVMYAFADKIKAGIQVSYADYHHDRHDGNKNKVKTTPLLVKGEYVILDKTFIRPFVGLGAGINFVNFKQERGTFRDHDNFTKAAFQGEIGALVPFSKSSRGGVRVSASYALNTFKERDIKHLNSFNVAAGVVIPITKGKL